MRLFLTKKFTFEMAHALDGYNGKCANLHGHSYHLEVTVEGTKLNADGMAMDFGDIKHTVLQTIINRFDHALVLKKDSIVGTMGETFPNLIEVSFNPTTENLLMHFSSLLMPLLPEGVRLHSLRLAETDTSVAELLL